MIESKQPRRLKRLWLLAVLASGAGLGWYLNRPGSDAPLYQSAVVSRGELNQFVTAGGQLNPVVKVEVGSQISGIIQKLLADFNSTVKEVAIQQRREARNSGNEAQAIRAQDAQCLSHRQ